MAQMFSHKYYSVILQVLSDTGKVVAKLNIVSGKFFGWPDARKKQQFGVSIAPAHKMTSRFAVTIPRVSHALSRSVHKSHLYDRRQDRLRQLSSRLRLL